LLDTSTEPNSLLLSTIARFADSFVAALTLKVPACQNSAISPFSCFAGV
jgi:hypothetical protein